MKATDCKHDFSLQIWPTIWFKIFFAFFFMCLDKVDVSLTLIILLATEISFLEGLATQLPVRGETIGCIIYQCVIPSFLKVLVYDLPSKLSLLHLWPTVSVFVISFLLLFFCFVNHFEKVLFFPLGTYEYSFIC